MGRLDGKVALISGGARGQGAAEAETFAREGAKVVFGDIRDAEGKKVEAAIRAAGHEAVYVHLDVTSEADWQTAVKTATGRYGKLDVLINNAAIVIPRVAIEDRSAAEWDQVMAVNAKGVFLGTKYAIPEMRRAGGGAIVNVGSVSSFIGQKGMLTYNATKAAIAEMTRCLALDLVDDKIRVNAVCPGAVWTSQVQRMAKEKGLTREQAALLPDLGAAQMMKRIADPREIGYAALFLASDEASFVTGANLMVDGGWTAL